MVTKTTRALAGTGALAIVAATGSFAVMGHSPPEQAAASAPSPAVVQAAQERRQSVEAASASTEIVPVSKPVTARVEPPKAASRPTPSPAPTPTPTQTYVRPVQPPPPSPGTAQGIAYEMMPEYGFDQSGQFACLVELWTSESSWESWATEPASGAYGIAQALGHGTAADQGTVSDGYGGYGLTAQEAVEANSGDATEQIAWGLGYISSAYGTPCAAEQNELAFHYY